MRLKIQVQDGAIVVRVRGRSLRTGDGDVKLREVLRGLLQAGARRVVLDLGKVRSVDGGALEELRRWGEVYRWTEATLHVVMPPLRSASDRMRLRSSLRVFPALAEALSAIHDEGRVRLRSQPRSLKEVLTGLPQAV